jgi:hypothetical protein
MAVDDSENNSWNCCTYGSFKMANMQTFKVEATLRDTH